MWFVFAESWGKNSRPQPKLRLTGTFWKRPQSQVPSTVTRKNTTLPWRRHWGQRRKNLKQHTIWSSSFPPPLLPLACAQPNGTRHRSGATRASLYYSSRGWPAGYELPLIIDKRINRQHVASGMFRASISLCPDYNFTAFLENGRFSINFEDRRRLNFENRRT